MSTPDAPQLEELPRFIRDGDTLVVNASGTGSPWPKPVGPTRTPASTPARGVEVIFHLCATRKA